MYWNWVLFQYAITICEILQVEYEHLHDNVSVSITKPACANLISADIDILMC